MSFQDSKRRKSRAEAAAWLVRLRSEDLTEVEKAGFQAWLAEDINHAEAFEAINNAWESVGAVGRGLGGYRRPQTADHGTRRHVLAGLGIALVAGTGLAYRQSARAEVYQTTVGEQRHVVLNEGCQVFLDTNTRLVVHSGSLRSATLEYGCANFRVLSDKEPFVVKAAGETISTTRSDMDVRQENGQLSVLVVEGEATVTKELNYGVLRLGAGDRLLQTGSKQLKVERPATAPLLAWHNGQAIFRNDRLADAIAEMNRYSVVKLVAADQKAANERISGVYSVGDNLAFANSIAKLLPLRVIYSDKRIEVSFNEP